MKNKILFVSFIVLAVGFNNTLLRADQPVGTDHTPNEFQQFFFAGGWLVWFILLPLSLVTIKLIIQYLLDIRRKKFLPPGVVSTTQQFLENARFQAALDYLQQEGSFLARILHVGLAQASDSRNAMDNAMAEMLEQDTGNLFRRIEWLNVIGNVAPMIGLFGTVWGMIEAFNAIVRAGGQPEPAQLAGGISIALVTTWWGLVIAIPALAAYGSLRNRIDSLSTEAALAADKLLRHIHALPVEPQKHSAKMEEVSS